MAKGGFLGCKRPQTATRKAAFCRPGCHRTHKSCILSDTYFLFCLKIHTKAKYHNERHKPLYAYTCQVFKCPNHKPTLACERHTVNARRNSDRSMLNINTKILRIIIGRFRIKKKRPHRSQACISVSVTIFKQN